MTEEAPIVRVRGLRKVYDTGRVSVEALRGVDLDVAAGDFLAIVGPSGSGKSTLFHVIGGMTPPTGGEVVVAGYDMAKCGDTERTELRRKAVSFVFQKFNLLPNLTVRDNIRAALHIAGLPSARFDHQLTTLIGILGIDGRLEHKPSELSGGEQQRVAIARALATNPRLLLADEPTGNLDPHTADHVFGALMQLVKATRVAMLIATHNMELAGRMDRRVSLVNGQVVELD